MAARRDRPPTAARGRRGRSGLEPELEHATREAGIGALALSPLVHGGRLLGAIALYRDEPHVWGERETRLCRTIASHLASATVRTRARNALRASREQLETILRTVDEGIVVQDRRGRLVYANAAAAALIGFETTEELLGADRGELQARFELYDEHGRPLSQRSFPGAVRCAANRRSSPSGTGIRSTGEERWSVVRANPVTADDGSVELSVSVVRDVTAATLADRRAQASVERLGFLARAGNLLAGTLDFRRTLGALAQLAVPSFAGHVTVDLYEDGLLRCVAARHVDPKRTELMLSLREEYPPTVPEHPVQVALRSGEAQLVPDVQALADSMAHDERHARAIRELENTSGIVVPLIARGRTLGAITFGTVPPQPAFTTEDLELAQELGRRASVALDNAMLFGEVQARAHAAEALEFVDDGVLLVDRDEVVRLWNPAAEKTFRISAREAIGRPLADVIEGWPALRDRIGATRESRAGTHRAHALPVDVRGEERWLSVSAAALPGRHGLRLPRPHRGARGRADEDRLRLHGLARAADAARRDLRRRADAPARGRPAGGVAADGAAGRDRRRGRPAGPHRQRHPLGEPPRLGPAANRDREL